MTHPTGVVERLWVSRADRGGGLYGMVERGGLLRVVDEVGWDDDPDQP
jgi:hypothetical protein